MQLQRKFFCNVSNLYNNANQHRFLKNVEINSSQVNFCKIIQITYYFWKEGGDMTWNV